jgi:hypothetical protein
LRSVAEREDIAVFHSDHGTQGGFQVVVATPR